MIFRTPGRSSLKKKARRGFRGYPIATVALYGPDDRLASKVVVGIVASENAQADPLERWISTDHDIRTDISIERAIVDLITRYGVKTVVITDRIIGCPHEEGIDYPAGAPCPQCPFWRNRDRWTGEIIQ